DGQGDDDLVVVGPAGGYIASGYAAVLSDEPPLVRAWYVNPFRFFRHAFATDDVPKLDTTTMSGRRIFYSHIDGDAWHNMANLQLYRGRPVVAAEVVHDQILVKYPDLPATVAPISGDLDTSWYGSDEAKALARKMFALPNVEAGSHTHSHPFAWMFFRNYDPKQEAPFLSRYPARPGKSQSESVWESEAASDASDRQPKAIDGVYSRPRSYAVKPFDLDLEIGGSIRFIQALLPPGKRVEIMHWSGDTVPWEKVVSLTRAAKVRNINGGDPRMDGQYDSYAWVSPLARRVGKEWQIYSSGANENIYTDNWRSRHYAFRYLIDSLHNMETPIRVKPINLYYHFYSAERPEGLTSLTTILDHVRTQKVAPVTTSRFAAMADGFLSARIVQLDERRWRIENHDGIETVRFDLASTSAVD
ncbi:MAG: polysaccharide deacetylase family protein, partial [Alphaproteobacteria bacterium]